MIQSHKVLQIPAKQTLTMEQDVSNQIHFRNINIPVPVPPSLLPPLCSPHLCSHIHARALTHTYKYMHTETLADTCRRQTQPIDTGSLHRHAQALQGQHAHRAVRRARKTHRHTPKAECVGHAWTHGAWTQGTPTGSDEDTPSR